MDLRGVFYYLIYSHCLVSNSAEAFGSVSIPLPTRNNEIQLNQHCHWEGQKISNPESGEKLFLCHFYSESNTWLLFPFHCASDHVFDIGAQRCIKKSFSQIYANQFWKKEIITEIPDFSFTPGNSILKNKNRFPYFHPGENVKMTSGGIDCEESLKSLTLTINTLSLAIVKLSEKINLYSIPNTQGSSNSTISITFPNFSSIHHILKSTDDNEHFSSPISNYTNSSKIMRKESSTTISQDLLLTQKLENLTSQIFTSTPTSKLSPSPPITTIPAPIYSKITTMTPIMSTTTVKSILQNPSVGFVELSSSSEEDTEGSINQLLKPGNNLFDFLFKNIFKSRPGPTPPQPLKTPFLMNTSRPSHYGVFKPLPFRPRPPPPFFIPFGGSFPPSIPTLTSYIPPFTNSPNPNSSPFPNSPSSNSPLPNAQSVNSKPKPNGEHFLNVMPFLHNLNQTPMTTYANDSEEDDDVEDEQGNDVIGTFDSTTPKFSETGSSTTTSPSVPSPASTLPIPTSSNPNPPMNSTKTQIPSIVSKVMRIVSSDSTEFKVDSAGDDDDETEDAQDPLRQNNRKPRREGLMDFLK